MIYLDHAATTRPYPEVVETVCQAMGEDFWNPSSMYKPSREIARRMKDAMIRLAMGLGCEPDELIQTSCATEATNMALKGLFSRSGRRLNTIIATEADHDATLETLRYLEGQGARVILLKPTREGLIDPEELEKALDEKTLAVSILYVNNETGVCQPLETLTGLIRSKAPQAFIHADMVQAWGKLPLNLKRSGVDLASFSAHKIHGPKGVGLLYKSQKTMPDPLIHGGGQQRGWRSGTENWASLAGMAKASELQFLSFEERKAKVTDLSRKLREGLTELGAVLSFPDALPEITSASFPGLRGETLLHMLEDEEIYVSTSSACQSGSGAISHVLKACRMDKKKAQGTLRISVDAANTAEEIDTFLRVLRLKLDQLKAWQMF